MFDVLDEGGTGRVTQQDLRAGLEKAQLVSKVSYSVYSVPYTRTSINYGAAKWFLMCSFAAGGAFASCCTNRLLNRIVAKAPPQTTHVIFEQVHDGRAQSMQSNGQYLHSSTHFERESISTMVRRCSATRRRVYCKSEAAYRCSVH